jgi:hypothetical protein
VKVSVFISTHQAAIPMIAKQAFKRQQIPYIDRCGGNLKFKQIQ